VSQSTVASKPIAAIAASTDWDSFPALWRQLLDEVWTTVRAEESIQPGRNVMLYHDDVPNVEIGCEVEVSFEPIGRVVPSSLPSGRVATTLLRGSYDEIGAAHEAVIAWCDERGLERAGPRWEIYGHWVPNEADQEVEIYWLLA
jgi:effector-binding domain-containing protein